MSQTHYESILGTSKLLSVAQSLSDQKVAVCLQTDLFSVSKYFCKRRLWKLNVKMKPDALHRLSSARQNILLQHFEKSEMIWLLFTLSGPKNERTLCHLFMKNLLQANNTINNIYKLLNNIRFCGFHRLLVNSLDSFAVALHPTGHCQLQNE